MRKAEAHLTLANTMSNEYDSALNRLVALGGTDEGFYVLALHSFLEGFSNTIKEGLSYYASFPEVIDLLMEYLDKRGRLTLPYRQALVRIAKEHDMANRVRHQFKAVTKDEAVAATHNFLAFCMAFGIEGPALADLRNSLSLFDQHRSSLEIAKELDRTRKRLSEKEAQEGALLEKAMKYDALEAKLKDLSAKDMEHRAEIERLRQSADQRSERIDELRKRLFDISRERDTILAELEQSRDIGEYLQFLERFTQLTRTRLDYERSFMRLTNEQEEAASMVSDQGDYIVKGGAGTGKTLVLLHTLERYVGAERQRLDLGQTQKVVLLTYTNTLVKYSRYLARVVGKSESAIIISTADSFLLSALKVAAPGAWIDFKSPASQISEYNSTSFLSDVELAIEIEDVIWGNLVTKEEYLEKHILRRGMKQPLSTQQRLLVWSIQEKLKENLVATKRFTRNLACAVILEALNAGMNAVGLQRSDRIFIDEAQDLSTALIRCMKELSTGGIVLAADDGQSIYKIGAQYLRAGLAIAGHTRILKSNFRNTRQIHELAERFLVAGASPSQSERASSVDREGPSPELVIARTEPELLAELLSYVDLATGRLGYDPENIGILVPSNSALDAIKTRLAAGGRPATGIKDEKFDFATPGIIRLSTLHSSKGIEFPVVFIYSPSLPPSGDYDDRATISMLRNLLYVALTRAMDYVVFFTLEDMDRGVINELTTAMRLTSGTS